MINSKKSHNDFDCAVTTCGGIDSLYVLYLIRCEYGLNPLVITIDNGFLNPIAKENLQKIINLLGVKNIYFNPKLTKSLYRYFLLETGTFCTLCVYSVLYHIIRIAYENGIKILVGGMSKREDAFLPHGATPFNLLSIINKYRNEFSKYEFLQRKPFLFFLYRFLTSKFIDLPDYISWDESKNKRFLEEKFSINLGAEHYDCTMHEFANLLAYKKYGFSRITLKYCQMIRNGKITREKALERIKEEENRKSKNIKYFMDYFDLADHDVNAAIERSKDLESRLLGRIGQFLRRLELQRSI